MWGVFGKKLKSFMEFIRYFSERIFTSRASVAGLQESARGVEDDGFVLFDFVEGFFGFFKERGGVIAGFTVIF